MADGTLILPEGVEELQSLPTVVAEAHDKGLVGHSGSLQPATRLAAPVVGNYGVRYPRGTALIQRADFNTLDNPFFWSCAPRAATGWRRMPAPGLHFVSFAATS